MITRFMLSAVLAVAAAAVESCGAGEPASGERAMAVIQLEPADGDNSPRIVKALEALKAQGGGTLALGPGRYLCLGGTANSDGRTHGPSVQVSGLRKVTIDGRGATLVGRDIAKLLSVSESEDVTVRNLTIDWDPLPHTSGVVVSVDAGSQSYDIRPVIPSSPVAGRIVQGVLAYNSSKRRLADNGWEIYQTQGERDGDVTQRTAAGNLRVFQKRNSRLPEVGWEVVVRHQVYGYDALVFTGCSRVTIEDVTVHAVPGMAVIGWVSRDITIRRIRVVPAGEGWMSATADAMHFNGCRGTITVEDSEFAGMGDDAINIHAMYGLTTGKVDERTLAIARGRMHPYYDKKRTVWDLPRAGDVLEYGWGEEPLLARGRLVVAEARQDRGQERTVVKFTEALPAEVGENVVVWNLSTSPAVRIRRCFVHGNRARGMLLQTRDVLVEGCRFEDVSGAGVQICTDAADWWESLGSREVTVKDCVFRRCNFGVARRAAALDVFSDLAKGRQSAAGVHQGIRVTGCQFEGNGGGAIHIGSAVDVEVTGNQFREEARPVVRVVNSRKVKVKGNTGLPAGTGVTVSGSSEAGTIEVE